MIAGVLFYYAAWASPPSVFAAPTFAGTYATRVTLKRDDCGGVKVEDNPTIVTHDTVTSIVTLRHAGTTYGGRVGADSTFRTQPKPVDVNDGFVYTISISGRFKANAFEAEATVDKAAKSGDAKCRFVVGWTGTKA
jgi:hypothetical protein